MRGAAAQAATASGVNQTVRLPRARRPASYSAQLVTRCRRFGMWRRQAVLALNGTAGVQASEKGPSSYTAQLPTPTGRSVQQGDPVALLGNAVPAGGIGLERHSGRPPLAIGGAPPRQPTPRRPPSDRCNKMARRPRVDINLIANAI